VSADFKARYGPAALVAGASEGIGAAFATELARRRLDLILVARRTTPLEEFAAKLRTQHRVNVETGALDLAAPDLAARAAALIEGREVGLCVYNAAHSRVVPFLDADLDDHLRTIDVNCRGPVTLAFLLGKKMAERGRGGVVLMSSLAGSQGTPLLAVYGASKAFNLVLGEALWDELARCGVDVLACRAGATRTPNFERSQPTGKTPMMDPEPVVAAALAALGKKPSVVPGAFNRTVAFFIGRIFSRRRAVKVIGGAARKLYGAS
jgi:short-subunit dehydrogenase